MNLKMAATMIFCPNIRQTTGYIHSFTFMFPCFIDFDLRGFDFNLLYINPATFQKHMQIDIATSQIPNASIHIDLADKRV